MVFYSYTYQWFPLGQAGRARLRWVANAVVFGLLAVVLMRARIEVGHGPYIDARAVPVALVGLFEGWPAGLVAAAFPALYRVAWLGGPGAPAGTAAVFVSGLLGGLAHLWMRRDGRYRKRHALALIVAVYLVTWASYAAVGAYGRVLFARVWVPLLLAHVIGIAFAGRLMRDVLEQARLQAERERFRAILDEASDAIRIVDAETFTIIDVNSRDCELGGYRRGEMIGRDDRAFWPDEPEQRARHEATAAAARARGSAHGDGLPYRRRDGSVVAVDATRRIVPHRGRRYEIVMARDAAERVATETARREAGELRAITLLAGAAAHEINNPLAVIMGALDLLNREVPPGTPQGQWVEQALGGVRRIRDIVRRMQNITKIESQPGTGTLPPILDFRKSSQEEPWTSSST